MSQQHSTVQHPLAHLREACITFAFGVPDYAFG